MRKAALAERAAAGGLGTPVLPPDATFAEARRGACVGRIECGTGVKVELVVGRTGIPVGTRFERDVGRYDGLVYLACAFIILNRLVK